MARCPATHSGHGSHPRRPAGRRTPAHQIAGRGGDKAYSSRRNRRYLRRRQIKHTIPEPKNQRANRQARGSKGGRPAGYDKAIFLDCGIPAGDIRTGKPYLPGYYRVRKQWDLVVLYKEVLVAALEFRSQVGSVGKNFNNRFEEALGSATDLAAAHKKNSPFGAVPPWLGYVFVLEEAEETEKLNRQSHALFETDPVFKGMSYTQRYQEMISRFVGENVYDIGWFITTQRAEDGSITYKEPLPTATARTLQVAIEGRIKLVKAMLAE